MEVGKALSIEQKLTFTEDKVTDKKKPIQFHLQFRQEGYSIRFSFYLDTLEDLLAEKTGLD